MEGFEGFTTELWNPFARFGLDNDALKINIDTVYNTWAVLGVIILGIIICRSLLKNAIFSYLVTSFITGFMDLTKQALGFFHYKHFAFVTSLFLFILLCNWISLIPGIEEPTTDLNTTAALAIFAFFYKEYYAIKAAGIVAFIKEFFHPFAVMLPLNLIGHYSKIISMAFRLFGNIFGGSIITGIYTSALAGSIIWELIGLLSGLNFIVILFFVLFEGLIQAFVFMMLTLTYLALALQAEQEGEVA